MTTAQQAPLLGIYVHIPFCRTRCPYCHFNTYARKAIPEREYVRALCRELDRWARQDGFSRRPLESVYFGGGTPSLFKPESIAEVIDCVREYFGGGVSPARADQNGLTILARRGRHGQALHGPEITLECFPDAEGMAKLDGFRKSGVTRISFGIQAMDQEDRASLWRGRSLSPEIVLASARDAGFDNVGFDFIYGRPGQEPEAWKNEMDAIARLGVPHVSLYILTDEDDGMSQPIFLSRRFEMPSEDDVSLMAESAWVRLQTAGYRQYELSNFALPGFECRHNLIYWTPGGEYLGLGAGAHSFVGGKRWENARNPEDYMSRAESGRSTILSELTVERGDAMREFLYLGLRRDGGVSITEFESTYREDVVRTFPVFFELGERQGLLARSRDRLALTGRGRLFSDSLFRELF